MKQSIVNKSLDFDLPRIITRHNVNLDSTLRTSRNHDFKVRRVDQQTFQMKVDDARSIKFSVNSLNQSGGFQHINVG